MPVGGKRKAESAMSQKDEARAKRRARWVSESEKTQSMATKVDSDDPVGGSRPSSRSAFRNRTVPGEHERVGRQRELEKMGSIAVIRMPVGEKRKAESAMSQKDEARAKRRARWMSESEETQSTATKVVSESEKTQSTATKVDSPVEFGRAGQHHNRLWKSVFEIDRKYVLIKAIGEGAYGVVCSATNTQTGEKVAIKKVAHAFSHPEEARRMLREIVLLRHLVHENIIPIKDIMKPVAKHGFSDVCAVYELMDTELHHIISSSQNLTDDHCKYCMYRSLQVLYVPAPPWTEIWSLGQHPP